MDCLWIRILLSNYKDWTTDTHHRMDDSHNYTQWTHRQKSANIWVHSYRLRKCKLTNSDKSIPLVASVRCRKGRKKPLGVRYMFIISILLVISKMRLKHQNLKTMQICSDYWISLYKLQTLKTILKSILCQLHLSNTEFLKSFKKKKKKESQNHAGFPSSSIFFFFFGQCWGVEPTAPHTTGRRSTTKLHPILRGIS